MPHTSTKRESGQANQRVLLLAKVGRPAVRSHDLNRLLEPIHQAGRAKARPLCQTLGVTMLPPVFIALALALLAGLLWQARERAGWPVLTLAWCLYAAYEYLMYQRVLCTGECNIRVDLLLFYPVLVGASIWQAVALAVHKFKQSRRTTGGA